MLDSANMDQIVEITNGAGSSVKTGIIVAGSPAAAVELSAISDVACHAWLNQQRLGPPLFTVFLIDRGRLQKWAPDSSLTRHRGKVKLKTRDGVNDLDEDKPSFLTGMRT